VLDNRLGIGSVKSLPSIYSKYGTQDFVEWYKQQASFVGANVIDIGCGTGHPFSEFVTELGCYVGVEGKMELTNALYLASIDNGWSNVVAAYADFDTANGMRNVALEANRFCDGGIDVIASNFSMVYLKNPRDVFEFASNVLGQGGLFLVSGYGDGNNSSMYQMQDKAVGYLPPCDRAGFNNVSNYLGIANEFFGSVEIRKFRNDLVFPTAGEFINYYTGTVTCEETLKYPHVQNLERRMYFEASKQSLPIVVSKHIELLVCSGGCNA
jgi:SAM-dependent methyltransferase